jgi:hypothetical protein
MSGRPNNDRLELAIPAELPLLEPRAARALLELLEALEDVDVDDEHDDHEAVA